MLSGYRDAASVQYKGKLGVVAFVCKCVIEAEGIEAMSRGEEKERGKMGVGQPGRPTLDCGARDSAR